MSRALFPSLLIVALLGCTGRTTPATLVGLEPAPAVDAGGPVDAGTPAPADAAVSSAYGPCEDLSDCPAGTVRCSVERAGICNPPCGGSTACPPLGGRDALCVSDGNDDWCIVTCRADDECPDGYVCTPGLTCVNQ